jgi:hypothetical protein
VLLLKGLPQIVQRVTGTLSWLLAGLLSGLVRLAVAVKSPGVVLVVAMAYVLRLQTKTSIAFMPREQLPAAK